MVSKDFLYNGRKIKVKILNYLLEQKVDLLFLLFIIILVIGYTYYIFATKLFPIHDGAIYLLNAHDWLAHEPLHSPFRPQLISWIIAAIWSITGENWVIVKGLQAFFTVVSGILLYVILRKYKKNIFAFGVTILTMLNGIIFYYSTHILTEGLSLFFLVLTLYFLKTQKENYWFFAGIAMGLTFASRYPILLQALVILVVESAINRNLKLAIRAISGMVSIIIAVILAVYLKTGTFQIALAQDTNFSIFLSPYYLINSLNIWGFAFLFVPIAFLYKRTYTDSFNYTFIAWFIVSMIFWSANDSNWQDRFVVQYTPAVYFLAMLGIEHIKRRSCSVFTSNDNAQ
jgi:4-amino-4-deoxy-L-arabinose transferase-like glycosyltransferase